MGKAEQFPEHAAAIEQGLLDRHDDGGEDRG
jgi:hypothetical protein